MAFRPVPTAGQRTCQSSSASGARPLEFAT